MSIKGNKPVNLPVAGLPVTVNQLDGIRLPEGMIAEHVKVLRDRLVEQAEFGRKADKVIADRKGGICEGFLSIARDCTDVKEFIAACDHATAMYKSRHRAKKMPTVWTQTRSDIRRFFDLNIPLSQRDEKGETLTYSKMKKIATKVRRDQLEKAAIAVETTKPKYIKDFDSLVELLRTFVIDRQSEQYHDDASDTAKFFGDVNSYLAELTKEWVEKHPIAAVASDEEGDNAAQAAVA